MAVNVTGLANSIADGIIIDAYDKALRWQLRSMPVYMQFVDVHPMDPTNNSLTYHLKRHDYLPGGDRAVAEYVEPTSLTAPETIDVVITATERAALIERSFLLPQATYIDVDEPMTRQLATDLADYRDGDVRDVLLTTTNVAHSVAGAYTVGGTAASISGTDDLLTSAIVRRAVRDLRSRSTEAWRENKYVGVVSPEQSVDLREETEGKGWRDPHNYVDTMGIYNGEIGTYEGAIFIETPRVFSDTDGLASEEVHRALFLGREGVAQAVKKEPGIGLSPVVDKLARHRGIFWHGLWGSAVYRHEAIQLVYTGVTA